MLHIEAPHNLNKTMFLEASITITFAKSHSIKNEMLTPMVLVCLNKKVLTLGLMGTYPTPPPHSSIWVLSGVNASLATRLCLAQKHTHIHKSPY
jgi:hypothetical protein